jgi:hypothetical protein
MCLRDGIGRLAQKEKPMRCSWMVLAVLALVLTAVDVCEGGLGDEDFKSLGKRVNDSLKDKNVSDAIKAIDKLAQDNSGRLVDFLFSISSKHYTAELVEAIKQALGRITDSEGIARIIKAAPGAKPGLRPALAQVLGAMKEEGAFDVLLKYLDMRDQETVRETAKVIARKRDKRAVDRLISSLERWQDRDSGVVAELRYALINCTGADGGGLDKAEDWRTFWKKQSSGSSDLLGPSPETASPKKPDFFGTSISSMRFVFIIDISGSMNVVDPDEGSASGKVIGKTTPDGDFDENKPQGQTRIDRTKAELIKAIKALSKDVKFNIITYCHDVSSWKSDLQEASDANKSLAVDFVGKLTAGGLTHTDDALRAAFKNKDADTFLLLSDGAPTHEGGDACEEWGGHRDSKELIERIYKEVAELNRLRGVCIDTIGFKDANMDFMRKLAKDNGGTCVELK